MKTRTSGEINLIPHWSGQTTKDQSIMGTFEYNLPYNMMLSGGAGYMESRYYGVFGQARMLNSNGDYRIQSMRGIDYHTRTFSSTLKLQGEFDTGMINHNWHSSFDFVKRQRDFNQTPTISNFGSTVGSQTNSTPSYADYRQGTNKKLRSYSFAFQYGRTSCEPSN